MPVLPAEIVVATAVVAVLALVLALLAHVRVSRLRRELTQPNFNTPVVTQRSAPAPVAHQTATSVVDTTGVTVSPRVLQLAAQGQKIAAIKVLREESGLALRDAKDIVDRL